MPDKIRFSFTGSIDTDGLEVPQDEVARIINALNGSSGEIAQEINHNLLSAGLSAQVFIHFQQGSIDWFGWVDVLVSTVRAMADIGGAIGFIQIVRSAIDNVLRRRFRPILAPPMFETPRTTVIIASSSPLEDYYQSSRAPAWVSSASWAMFGAASLLLGSASVLAALALLLLALAKLR